MTPAAIALLELQEGFRSRPYQDTRGNWTVGFGTNLSAGISRSMAVAWLMDKLETNYEHLLDEAWFANLDDIRQSVIENMAYNMGIDGVLGFHDMIAAIEDGDYSEAAHQMLNSIWAEQVGERATILAEIMRTGKMS